MAYCITDLNVALGSPESFRDSGITKEASPDKVGRGFFFLPYFKVGL